MKKKDKLVKCVVFIIICLLWIAVTPTYDGDSDNYTMALVVNRMFAGETQNVYVSYLNPILCLIFQFVLLLFPMADCFTLTAIFVLLFAIGVLAYLIAERSNSHFELLGYYAVLFALIVMKDLFHYNFTRWAAFLSAVGMIVLLLLVHRKLEGRRWIAIASVLLGFGLMWRYEPTLIFIPFIVWDIGVQVLFLGEDLEEKKIILKRIVRVIAVPMLVLVILGIVHVGIFQVEGYREAKAYDDIRSAVLDYPLKDWEEISEQIPKITENDYYAAREWILMDTERMDTSFFQQMLDAGETKVANIKSLSDIADIQKSVLSVFMSTRNLQYLAGLAILLFVVMMLSELSWYYKLQTVFAYLGTDLICLYFVYAGRAIERVFILLIYALLASLFIILSEERAYKKNVLNSILRKLVLAFGIVGVVYAIRDINFAPQHSVFNAKSYAEFDYSIGYDDDEIYIWDVQTYASLPMRAFALEGKLMPIEYMEHNICDGGWEYGQIYFEQLLENIDLQNPMYGLVERENVYYVAYDYQRVLTYLQEHYSENVIAECQKEIQGVPVWQFKVTEEN